MAKTKGIDHILILLGTVIFIFGQTHFLLSNDIFWLIKVGQSWLGGGQYLKDFFETNPPLAFYIYLPIYALQYFFALSLTKSFLLYYGLIFALSLILTNRQLCHLKQSPFSRCLSLLILFFGFLYLPNSEIGQRDLFAATLILPHIFYVFVSIEGAASLARWEKRIILVMAAVGYMIKPYFILIWLSLFATVYLSNKNLKKSLKYCDTKFFVIAGLIYITTVLLSSPEYLFKALPIVLRTYYPSINASSYYVFFADPRGVIPLWLLSTSLFCVYGLKVKNIPSRYRGYFVLTTGFMLVYVAQGLAFEYHAMPSIIFGFLLSLLIIMQRIRQQYYLMGFFALLLSYATVHAVTKTFKSNRQHLATLSKLKQTFKFLPKQSKVAVLLCDNNNAQLAAYQSNMIIASAFLAHFQICGAYVYQRDKVFNEVAKYMQADLLKFQPTYLIRHKGDFKNIAKETELYNRVFDKPPTQKLWRQYEHVLETKDYAVYKLS